MKSKSLIGLVLAMVLACGMAFGATYTNFTGSGAVLPTGQGVVTVQNTINFATRPVATTDVVKVIGVPSGATVLAVGYSVNSTNAPVTVSTFDIGDTGSATQYKSAGTVNTAGIVQASVTGKIYTAADALYLTFYGTITNGNITAWAVIAAPPRL